MVRAVARSTAVATIGHAPEHSQLAESVSRFLRSRNTRQLIRRAVDGESGVERDLWVELGRQGWLGLHLPEEMGGSGFGLIDQAVVLEQYGYELAPGPMLQVAVVTSLLATCASDSPTGADVLVALADGACRPCLAVGRHSITKVDERMTGTAVVVGGAPEAELIVLPVGDDVVMVQLPTPAIEFLGEPAMDPSLQMATVRFDNVEVASATVLIGAAKALTGLVRLWASVLAIGIARSTQDLAVAYAMQRSQFGRPIGSFQAVKHICADMAVRTELAAAAVWDALMPADGDRRGEDSFDLACATAGAMALPAAVRNAQKAIQIHGGMGFTWEHDAHLFLRRATMLQMIGDPLAASRDVTNLRCAGVTRRVAIVLPDEVQAQRAEVRAVAARLRRMTPRDQIVELVDSGYAQPRWPRPWGLDADAALQSLIVEEFDGVSLPEYGISGYIALTIVGNGTEDQIERWVRPTLLGDIHWCQLFSEPDAGSDAASIRTTAVRTAGGWLVNGQKIWTTHAQECEWGLVTVRTDPSSSKHAGITTMALSMSAEGVLARPLRDITGASPFNEVFFADVFVPDADVIGPVNRGWSVARATLGNERLAIGARSDLSPLSEATVLDLYQRSTRVDGSHSVALGTLLAEGRALTALNVRATQRAVSGGSPGPEGNITKLVRAEHAQRMADIAAELSGVEGVVSGGPGPVVTNALLYTRMTTIAGGTSEITRNQIAERILGMPREPGLR
jgi:3-oxochol-4-en-24-oyl-CoA dehydrogenase